MSLRQFYQNRLNAMPPVARAAYWMTISAFGYSASAALVHHLTQRLPVFEVAMGRNIFALCFMVPWLMKVGLKALRTQHLGMHATRGILSAANMWCLFGALSLAPVADVSAITFMMPIIASILAVIFLKESTTLQQWLAALAGFAGALIVIRPGMSDYNPGLLLAVGAVLAGSGVAMMIKSLLKYDSPDTVAVYLFGTHIIFGLVPTIVVWVTPTLAEVGWFVVLGYLGALIQRTFNRAMSETDASVALPFNFTRLLWAAMFGYLFFAQVPDLWTWVGGSIIFLASIWLTRIGAKRGQKIVAG